jgi:general secretion pathway protein C
MGKLTGMEITASPAFEKSKYLFYLILVSVGVYFLSSLFVFYTRLKLADQYSPSAVDMNLPKQISSEKPPLEHFKTIWERNLFSAKVDEEKKPEPQNLLSKIDALSVTTLNCTLIGTILNDEGESWAIIQDNQTNRQDRYTVGSTVSGAKVVMILRNKVVLNIDGRDELLVMGIEKIRTSSPEAEKADTTSIPRREPARSARGPLKSEGLNYTISRDLIQQSVNNMAQLMSAVRMTPYLKDGNPEGFRLTQIKDDSLFKAMGLQNGDILMSINGQSILAAGDMVKAYSAIKYSNSFTVGIMRNNRSTTLNYRVR